VTTDPDQEAAGIAWQTGVWNRIADINPEMSEVLGFFRQRW